MPRAWVASQDEPSALREYGSGDGDGLAGDLQRLIPDGLAGRPSQQHQRRVTDPILHIDGWWNPSAQAQGRAILVGFPGAGNHHAEKALRVDNLTRHVDRPYGRRLEGRGRTR